MHALRTAMHHSILTAHIVSIAHEHHQFPSSKWFSLATYLISVTLQCWEIFLSVKMPLGNARSLRAAARSLRACLYICWLRPLPHRPRHTVVGAPAACASPRAYARYRRTDVYSNHNMTQTSSLTPLCFPVLF